MPELKLPSPLRHQRPMLDSPARFKVWRAGRRTGKSRGALLAGVAGHGEHRQRKGVLQGGDIVWFAPDYKQSQAIWREEIRPRFAGLPGVEVNESEKRISIPGLGSLQILSAENIDAARGRKLDGAIFDEGGYFDLEYAWQAVVRPALADRQGWAIFCSTTNAGHDGNQLKRVPSFFNLLCERVMRGELGAEWQHFHNRTRDNERLARTEVDAMYAEYGANSATASQELDAELNVLGGRYYQLTDVHLIPRDALPERLPTHWEYWGAFDWGYAHWAVGGVFARSENAFFLLDSSWQRRAQDDEYAQGFQRLIADTQIPAGKLYDILGGADCMSRHTARGASGVTTAEIFAERALYIIPADTDKVNGGRAVRRALAASDPSRRQGFYLVDTPTNRRVYAQLCEIIPDPNDVNKPCKVDADADGKGGDDGADMVRYGLATHVPGVITPIVKPVPGPDQDPWAIIEEPESPFSHLPVGF